MVMMVVVMVMMVVVVEMWWILLINDALDGAELLHVARDCDGALVIKSVLFLRLLQELHEERMVDVDDRDDKPLTLLLPLTDQDRQTPLGDVFQLLLRLLLMVVKMKVRDMDVEIQVVPFPCNPHFQQSCQKPYFLYKQKKKKEQKNPWLFLGGL